MPRLKWLKEEIASKKEELRNLNAKLEHEKRARTQEEKDQMTQLRDAIADMQEEFTQLEAEQRSAGSRAATQQSDSQRAAAAAAGGPTGESEARDKGKQISTYSFLRAINMQLEMNTRFDGLEAEMHQEAEKEARNSGVTPQGVAVPSFFISMHEKRDLTAGSATSAGNTIATNLSGELIPALRPQLTTQSLGARVMTGLRGHLDIARKTSETTAVWEGENDENAEGTPTTDKITMTPKRLGVTVDVSKQLLIQSSFDVEMMVRDDISFAVAKGIDVAAINGSGTGEPFGILNTAGISSVSIGTNGGAITYAKLIALKKAIAVDNALMGTLAFLTNPDVEAELEVTARQTGGTEGNFIKPYDAGDKLMSYRFARSTQVPNTLIKGSGSGLSALIFANWAELYIGQWAGLDIVVDPYSKKTSAMIEVTVNSWWDVALRHLESFAAIKDLTTSLVA